MAHLAFTTVERSSGTMPTVHTLHHGTFLGVSQQMGKRLVLGEAWVGVRRVRIGFRCNLSHLRPSCLDGLKHAGVACASMAEVVAQDA